MEMRWNGTRNGPGKRQLTEEADGEQRSVFALKRSAQCEAKWRRAKRFRKRRTGDGRTGPRLRHSTDTGPTKNVDGRRGDDGYRWRRCIAVVSVKHCRHRESTNTTNVMMKRRNKTGTKKKKKTRKQDKEEGEEGWNIKNDSETEHRGTSPQVAGDKSNESGDT